MSLEDSDLDKIADKIAQTMHMDHERESGAHKSRMVRLGTMTLVIVTIAVTGHFFHIEVIAKIGEVTVSCLYSYVMEMAQLGKDYPIYGRIIAVFRRTK